MAKKTLQKPVEINGALAVFDERIVNAAFALVDESITTREQATAVFSEVIEAVRTVADIMSAPSQWIGSRILFINKFHPRDIPSFDTTDWETGQRIMRLWLPQLANFDKLSGKKQIGLLREISETAESLGHSLRMRIGLRGIEWATERDTIANACCRAAMPFIMPRGWSPRRIGQCQYAKCGQWFLRPEPKRGSVPLYCSTKHANAARVTAFRQRQEAIE